MTAWRWLGVGTVLLSAGGALAAQERKVQAVIAAISDYPGAAISNAESSALVFSNLVHRAFPEAKFSMLLGTNCGLGRLRDELDRLSDLPDDSLLIFYFGGHGSRTFHSRAGQPYPEPGELYLVAAPVAPDRFRDAGLAFSEYALALARRRVNSMAFIDCCFAGQNNAPAFRRELLANSLGTRGFVLTACGTYKPAQRGYFMEGLTNALETLKRERKCVNALTLEQEVKKQVAALSHGEMTPSLAFPSSVYRCFGSLADPACLVVLTFPAPCPDVLRIYVDDQEDPNPFAYDDLPGKAVLVRQVPRAGARIRLEMAGKTNEFSVGPTNITGPFFCQSVVFTNSEIRFGAVLPPSRRTALALESFARLAEEYGYPTHEAYEKAGAERVAAGNNADELLGDCRRLSNDPVYRMAQTRSITPEDLNGLGDPLQASDRLRRLGRANLAAQLDHEFALRATQANPLRENLGWRAVAQFTAIGDNASAARAVQELKLSETGGLGGDFTVHLSAANLARLKPPNRQTLAHWLPALESSPSGHYAVRTLLDPKSKIYGANIGCRVAATELDPAYEDSFNTLLHEVGDGSRAGSLVLINFKADDAYSFSNAEEILQRRVDDVVTRLHRHGYSSANFTFMTNAPVVRAGPGTLPASVTLPSSALTHGFDIKILKP